CFELEAKLIEALDCPVMHDDQHGTAIVVLAALRGANMVLDRALHDQRVVISGAGAAGIACAKILRAAGVGDVTVLDSKGIIHSGRDNLNAVKAELAENTNSQGLRGGLAEALKGADVFIGLSSSTVEESLLATMAPKPIVFALSNPDPEVHPEVAAKYAAVVAFPGVFTGALDAGASAITENMKLAAAEAIASVAADSLAVDHIVPSPLDPRVAPEVAKLVAKAAESDGVATTVAR